MTAKVLKIMTAFVQVCRYQGAHSKVDTAEMSFHRGLGRGRGLDSEA